MAVKFSHFADFLQVCIFPDGSLVLHPQCVCLVHLLVQPSLLLHLLLDQLPVGLFLGGGGGETRGER